MRIGINFLHSSFIPIVMAEVHDLSTPVLGSIHGGYGTVRCKKGNVL